MGGGNTHMQAYYSAQMPNIAHMYPYLTFELREDVEVALHMRVQNLEKKGRNARATHARSRILYGQLLSGVSRVTCNDDVISRVDASGPLHTSSMMTSTTLFLPCLPRTLRKSNSSFLNISSASNRLWFSSTSCWLNRREISLSVATWSERRVNLVDI